MYYTHFLFSFDGRINRKKFWICNLQVFVASALFFLAVISIGSATGAFDRYNSAGLPLFLLLGGNFIAVMVALLSLNVRRLHDRGKSGWVLLIYIFLPAVLQGISEGLGSGFVSVLLALLSVGISLWYFVETGFLRGTTGPNLYGPDPLMQGA